MDDEPPVAWGRSLPGLQPDALVELLDAVIDLRDRPSDPRETADQARTLLRTIDELLAAAPSPPQRAEIVQIAHLLGRVAAAAHQQLGNRREASWFLTAAGELHKLAHFEPIPGPPETQD